MFTWNTNRMEVTKNHQTKLWGMYMKSHSESLNLASTPKPFSTIDAWEINSLFSPLQSLCNWNNPHESMSFSFLAEQINSKINITVSTFSTESARWTIHGDSPKCPILNKGLCINPNAHSINDYISLIAPMCLNGLNLQIHVIQPQIWLEWLPLDAAKISIHLLINVGSDEH